MAFHERDWSQRFGQLGDMAEGVYQEWASRNAVKYVRWGLNRPPFTVGQLPSFIAHAPDFLESRRLVEVKGFGRDRTLKVKLNVAEALDEWNEKMHVELFVYDSHRKALGNLSWDVLRTESFIEDAEVRTFHDGPEYHALMADDLPVKWESAA